MISYVPYLGGIRVLLEKKIVGIITTVSGGFQYQPKGSKNLGDVFPTVEAVKRSLED